MRFYLVLLSLLIGGTSATAQEKRPSLKKWFSLFHVEKVGGSVPEFHVPTLSGDTLDNRNAGVKLVILHFWATWCIPCREELPMLRQFADSLSDLPVRVWAISIDKPGHRSAVSKQARDMKLNFSIGMAANGDISPDYWAWGIPVTYLLNQEGKILGRMQGPRTWTHPEMIRFITEFLQQMQE